jgi:hypothetical protein
MRNTPVAKVWRAVTTALLTAAASQADCKNNEAREHRHGNANCDPNGSPHMT